MDKSNQLDRFRNLRFEDFGKLAGDATLKPHEKIGFPSVFREGFDREILDDIKTKINWNRVKTILDIGCGCGDLTKFLIDDAKGAQKKIVLVDSSEVLNQIDDEPHILKIQGRFPDNDTEIRKIETVDVIICYSVFHYVFIEGNPFDFIERALALLKSGGKLLLGDIPNATKRNRFLLTPAGEVFHRKLMNTTEKPQVTPFVVEPGKMDDGFILSLLTRYRNFGVETYLLPQPEHLPLSNSREDILFIKH